MVEREKLQFDDDVEEVSYRTEKSEEEDDDEESLVVLDKEDVVLLSREDIVVTVLDKFLLGKYVRCQYRKRGRKGGLRERAVPALACRWHSEGKFRVPQAGIHLFFVENCFDCKRWINEVEGWVLDRIKYFSSKKRTDLFKDAKEERLDSEPEEKIKKRKVIRKRLVF